jgi:hypothetical protein
MKNFYAVLVVVTLFTGCTSTSKKAEPMQVNNEMKQKAEEFATFRLTTDLSILSEKEKQMLPLLLEVAQIMDEIFWEEAFGNSGELFTDEIDEFTEKFLQINYGPWERLNNNKPFLPSFRDKPAGANFYPARHDKRGI